MKQAKKTITKRLRLSQDEWNLINAKLKETDLSFSNFALKSMIDKKIVVAKDHKILLFSLAKIGANLNQISKYCNTKKTIDRVVLKMIAEIEFSLSEIAKC